MKMVKIRTLIGLMVFGLVFSVGFGVSAQTPDGDTPAEEDVCDDLHGAAFGLCNAYCEALDCDSDEGYDQHPNACETVLAKFLNRTGTNGPPCDPCIGFEEPCPCDYDVIQPNDATCWPEQGTVYPMFFVCTNANCEIPSTFCALRSPQPGGVLKTQIAIVNNGNDGVTCSGISMPGCSGAIPTRTGLTQGENEACQCRLEQYTGELIQAGIVVRDNNGQPLGPGDISCSPDK